MPRETLATFDYYLEAHYLWFRCVEVGGPALSLLRLAADDPRLRNPRPRSCPPNIVAAAGAFAAQRRRAGEGLDDGWLNEGTTVLTGPLRRRRHVRLAPAFQFGALVRPAELARWRHGV